MTHTIEDVRFIIPEPLTPRQQAGVEAYLNDGTIPPVDPCRACEPNFIRALIARVQRAERDGAWPVPTTTLAIYDEVTGLSTWTAAQASPGAGGRLVSDEESGEVVEERPAPKPSKSKAK